MPSTKRLSEVLAVLNAVVAADREVDLGCWSVPPGSKIVIEADNTRAIVMAITGLQPLVRGEIRILGASAGSREARSVSAVARRDFVPAAGLTVIEHCILALRYGAASGAVPRFGDVLGRVGLDDEASRRADTLDAVGLWRLGVAMMLIRPLPLWVVELPVDYRQEVWLIDALDERVVGGGSVVLVGEHLEASIFDGSSGGFVLRDDRLVGVPRRR
ncbi:MAG: hypothetical protein ACYDHP_07790 [Ferrimicrobium sp.]